MIRETELSIHGGQVDCQYHYTSGGEIKSLDLKIKGEYVDFSDLLDLPWVYESLDAHHENLLKEENCEA